MKSFGLTNNLRERVMSQEKQRVLITGATGKVGGAVFSELDTTLPIRVFSRTAEAADFPVGTEIVQGDLTDTPVFAKALSNVDTVFLLWPFPSAEKALPVIKAIAQSGARVVYLSTAGANDPTDRTNNPISATHYSIEQMIEASISDWTIIRPTSFASNTLIFWRAPLASGDTVHWPLVKARLSVIHDGDIAAVIAQALISESFVGQRLLLTGPETISPAEELDAISSAIGRSLTMVEIPTSVAREHMLGSGMPASIVDGVLGYWTRRVVEPEIITTAIADILGRPARGFQTWANENVAKFKSV
jgi:uncharacterized protein YbjT (DUF2867 family)